MAIQPAPIQTTSNDFRVGWSFCYPQDLMSLFKGMNVAQSVDDGIGSETVPSGEVDPETAP